MDSLHVESVPLIPAVLSPLSHASPKDPLSWLDDIAELHHSSGDVSLASPGSTSPSSSSHPASSLGQRSTPTSPRSLGGRRATEDGYGSSSSQSSTGSASHNAKKSKISLDPSQPLTAKGRPRARVYVACHECRSRKIRCDGAKPVCFNCHRRDPTLNRCDYDSAPKRRGQDKIPGSRTRSAVGQRAPRRLPRFGGSDTDGRGPHGRCDSEHPNSRWRYVRAPQTNFEEIITGFDPSAVDVTATEFYQLPPPPPVEDEDEGESADTEKLPSRPNMRFARETWWGALLTFYATQDVAEHTLSTEERLATTQLIFSDIRALLRASVYWASFLHLPRFFETILDSDRRTTIQPGLFLSMLAVGAYAQSSELKRGSRGRARALKLIDLAHAALQASLSSNWIDIGLVQAAWFMTYFEMQAHPDHDMNRCRSTMLLLDSLIRLFSLTTLDADRPIAHYSIFATYLSNVAGSGSQPSFINAAHGPACTNSYPSRIIGPQSVPIPDASPAAAADLEPSASSNAAHVSAACGCAKYTLKEQWPTVSTVAPPWEVTTMWPSQSAEGEFRKEEGRRLVWSSVMLTAGHNSFTASLEGSLSDGADLFIKDYRNYAVLFPGQALYISGAAPVLQNNVWNLCLRAMFLWHTSVRCRSDATMSPQEWAQFATSAWLEADAIEAALDQHTCNLEGGMMHQIREFLFSSRLCVSYDSRGFAAGVYTTGITNFFRTKAEAWVRNQMWVTQQLWEGLCSGLDDELSSRPMLMWWFMGHIVRALELYKSDRSFLIALEASKSFALPLEYLLRLWPCYEPRRKWQRIRYQLVDACLAAGVAPPAAKLPPSLTEIKVASLPEPDPGSSSQSVSVA